MSDSVNKVIFEPLVKNNPITLQVLGICSALAVTSSLDTAITMSIGLTLVTAFSSFFISLIRHHIPSSIRIIVQLTIIASLVIVVDQFLRAYAYALSKELSVFVGLIITNCIVLGRAEGYAMKNGPILSFWDGIGNGLGYSLILLSVGVVRELLGSGSLLNYPILPLASAGGWFHPVGLMLLPPSAFFIIGLFIWGLRTYKPEQVEAQDYRIHNDTSQEHA
ncbi:MAG: NADH:ubiquinone reductase (Na(+)-transporting) subunit D [Gammaproteobacteria bacterium]|nr:NADH:ubiquinone reductase (Na(+)-transporting) subunit D [Gammaproteobacteria bacterium]